LLHTPRPWRGCRVARRLGAAPARGGTLAICPWLGRAKLRLGDQLGSAATSGEGRQNLLCAYLAAAVLVGLRANNLFGLWWLDPAVALCIAGLAVREGRRSWRGDGCECAACALPNSPFSTT
jgi:divalent metal cation (Fe/Co/Zn/Cd) transporter